MPHPNFGLYYPRCAALGLEPVCTGTTEHPGADEDDVKGKLGATRFAALMKVVTHVFSCGHRHYPKGYTRPDIMSPETGKPADLGGYEAHAIYFDDIEKFLGNGG
jgi:hypothetical protein